MSDTNCVRISPLMTSFRRETGTHEEWGSRDLSLRREAGTHEEWSGGGRDWSQEGDGNPRGVDERPVSGGGRTHE